MHPFSPMLLLSAFNQSYRTLIWCSPLLVVAFRFPRLPWGRREGRRQKYFCYLNHLMGTQVVNMSDCGSTLISPEIVFDEAVGLALDCWHFPFLLHYYQLIYQIFKYSIYIKRIFSNTLSAKANHNFLILLAYLSVGVFPPNLRLASDRCWARWPTVFVLFAVCRNLHWPTDNTDGI